MGGGGGGGVLQNYIQSNVCRKKKQGFVDCSAKQQGAPVVTW